MYIESKNAQLLFKNSLDHITLQKNPTILLLLNVYIEVKALGPNQVGYLP